MFYRYYYSADTKYMRDFCRLTREQFDQFHALIKDLFTHSQNHERLISSKEILAVSLRFLAHGIRLSALEHEFAIGSSTVSGIVREVSQAIMIKLKPIYLPPPTKANWLDNAEEFEYRHGFPHACGAIDGKHFWVKAPSNTGDVYFNYKGHFSVVMLALVYANSRFVLVDIGGAGRNSCERDLYRNVWITIVLTDSSLYLNSRIKTFMESAESDFPEPRRLDPVGRLPHVVLADGGFGLTDYVITPFSVSACTSREKIHYNMEISKGRYIVEGAFGQLVALWRVFLRIPEVQHPEDIILCGVLLHNFKKPGVEEAVDAYVLAEHSERDLNIARNPNTRRANGVRDKFVRYFSPTP